MRDDKSERLTRCIAYMEECDRNAVATEIGEMPSPHGTHWASYIQHRLRVMQCGIEEYTTRNYARLRLDKYIEWHRAIDQLAGYLVDHKPAIVMFGAGQMPANSPIKIRKHMRCPFSRKLIGAFEKRRCIVRMIDEYNSSQHCGICVKRFPRRTPKNARYKKCENCVPKGLLLPPTIVTNKSKRELQMERTIMKEWQRMRDEGNDIAAMLTEPIAGRLVPKKQRFSKTWSPNANANGNVDGAAQSQPIKHTVWHRDICAARLIMYRGK